MAADLRLKHLRGPGRRDFLRWSATVAAALGLSRARFLEALSGSAGVALADEAACAKTMRSIHFNASNGGLANWTLTFPHAEQATVNNANYSFPTPGSGTTAAGTDKPWFYGPNSPFKSLAKTRQMSAYIAGTNQAHTQTAASSTTIATGVGGIAAVAAIQSANPSLIPVIGINPVVFGAAPGTPAVATVPDAAGLVGLFDSVASKTLLSTPTNAALGEAYYKAFLGLNAAAGRSGVAKGYETGKVAANLLGKNLASQLTPSAADDAAYGVTASTSTTQKNQAHALITALKAFKLGLTSMVIIPSYFDDPHGLFGGGDTQAAQRELFQGKMLDAFMAQAAAIPDPACSSKTLADNIVMSWSGDTMKDPYNRSGWPDGTTGNSNVLYVFGNGFLKTGWFGQYTSNGITVMDPNTGQDVSGTSASVANTAAACMAYAVAKGDMRRVQDFYRGPAFQALTNIQQL